MSSSVSGSGSDSDSDSSSRERKKTKKSSSTSRRRGKKEYDSEDSNDDSDASDASDRSNSSNESDGPSNRKHSKKANDKRAILMAESLEKEYNQLRHTIHHLKRYLIEERGVQLPTIHLLGSQSGEVLLSKAKFASPNNSNAWLKWLEAWKEEHLDKARSRYQLLLQLKADLRCYSRNLQKQKGVKLAKEWKEAMLYGKDYEQIIKDKRDKLDEERFRKQRLRQKRDKENAEWEERATKMASVIQKIWRSRAAYRKIQAILDDVWEKVYDPEQEGYYYYNKKTDTATWEKPKLLKHEIAGTY
jgi:type III secretory pathway component EscV